MKQVKGKLIVNKYLDNRSKVLSKQIITRSDVTLSTIEKWTVLKYVKERLLDGFTESDIKTVMEYKIVRNQMNPLSVLSQTMFPMMLDQSVYDLQSDDDKKYLRQWDNVEELTKDDLI